MNSENKIVTTVYDIFGYSIIGMIAFGFGLLLQNYNSQNDLLNQFIKYSQFSSSLILLIAFHCLFICLFGFSYAVVIFHRSEQGDSSLEAYRQEELYNNAGKWIEIILVALFISVIVTWVLDTSKFPLQFWGYLLCSGLIFILPSIHYRFKTISANNEENLLEQQNATVSESGSTNGAAMEGDNVLTSTDRKEEIVNRTQTANWTKQTKYVLICPAILMIGVNIYLGASILELLRGNILYYVPMAFFGLFFLIFFLANKPSHIGVWIFIFSMTLLIIGICSFSGPLVMPFKNLFLAVMVSIFLSIFECWYVAFRQLKDVPNKKYIKVTSWIVTLTPAVVISLYPIQDFNIIYILTFFLGMLFTQSMWFFYILPKATDKNICAEDKKRLRKRLGFLRAILGLLVLVFLMLDKQIGRDWTDYLNGKHNSTHIDLWLVIPIVVPLIGGVISCFQSLMDLVKGKITLHEFRDKMKSCESLYFLLWRLLSYTIPIIFLLALIHFVSPDANKTDMSIFCMCLFAVWDSGSAIVCSIWHNEQKKQNSNNDEIKPRS